MKRDMDLIRNILLEVEARPTVTGIDLVEIPGHEQDEISYHVKLLSDAGFLEAHDLRTMAPDGFRYAPTALTNAGHDFLDAARNKIVWTKTMDKISEVSNSAPLDVTRAVLTQTFRKSLSL